VEVGGLLRLVLYYERSKEIKGTKLPVNLGELYGLSLKVGSLLLAVPLPWLHCAELSEV
jgi:hypothetical protein